uniref:Uncharacterized protein n=1 Tax=Pseudo-nitzschia delicatissima TaxID=44447 RepID=A0A7S0TD44_9STRA|mmetsp:Transcript_1433/g.3297  ORF Transcript_1433/g.3297 Transcript_1433/m.3297 type:complete len:122 (+) Transcript_1433:139-504(+)
MLSLKTLFVFLLVGQVASYSAWECRPLDAGACGAPHTEKSNCDATPSCCPGSIITDWRTGKMSCKHQAIDGVDYLANVTKSSESEIDVETLDLGEISSSSSIVNPLVATTVAAATVIVGLL